MVVADKVVMDKVRCRAAEESTQTVSTQAVVSCLEVAAVGTFAGTAAVVSIQVELNIQGIVDVVVVMDKAVVVGTCLRFESKLN